MTPIYQMSVYDCVVTCLAMISGQPHSTPLAKFPKALAEGVTILEAHAYLLSEHTRSATYASTKSWQDNVFGERDRFGLDSDQLWDLIGTRPALVTIPMHRDYTHCVLWTGTKTFDPWPGKGFVSKPVEIYEAIWIDALPLELE